MRVFQIRASPSLLAVTTRRPSGENSTERTSSRCPRSVTPLSSRTTAPVDRRARVLGRLGRGRPRRGAEERLQLRHPRTHRPIVAARREPVAWKEDRGLDRTVVPREDSPRRARLHLPGPCRAVPARGQHQILVVAEARAPHLVAVQREHRLPVARGGPDARGAVARGDDERSREVVEPDVVGASPGGPSNVRTRRPSPSQTIASPSDAGRRDQLPVGAERGAVHGRRMIENGERETVAAEDGCPALPRDDEAVQPRPGGRVARVVRNAQGNDRLAVGKGARCQRPVAHRQHVLP